MNAIATPRLDVINLRICILGSEISRASEAFDLDPRTASPSMVMLYEDFSDDFSHPVVDHGVVLRKQERAGSVASPGDEAVTVFIHPFRRAYLTPFWLAFHTQNGETLSVTEDWTGRTRTTAAALVTLRPRSANLTASSPSASDDLLSPCQRRFLAECADMDATTTPFTSLGPVGCRTWALRHDDLDITAQRWTTPPADNRAREHRFDVLELSTQTPPEDAAFVQPAFTGLVRRHGLEADETEAPVAYRAVTHLARQARNISG